MPVEEPASEEEGAGLIAKTRPGLMMLVGYGGHLADDVQAILDR